MKGLTTKQAALVQGIASGKSTLAAARDAGYQTPHVSGYQALDSTRVQKALNRLMDQQGLSERKLLKPIKDGLDANRILGSDSQGQTVETPDHHTRLHAAEIGWKLRGYLMPKQDQRTFAPTQINVIHNYRSLPQADGNGHAHD